MNTDTDTRKPFQLPDWSISVFSDKEIVGGLAKTTCRKAEKGKDFEISVVDGKISIYPLGEVCLLLVHQSHPGRKKSHTTVIGNTKPHDEFLAGMVRITSRRKPKKLQEQSA